MKKTRTLAPQLSDEEVLELHEKAMKKFLAQEQREMQNAYLNDGSSNFKTEQVGQWIEVDESEILPRRKKR